jgi:hypothetical protein
MSSPIAFWKRLSADELAAAMSSSAASREQWFANEFANELARHRQAFDQGDYQGVGAVLSERSSAARLAG